jgi:multiple RNA-binding domain-containing protein 1
MRFDSDIRSKAKERSQTVLLIKNFPFATEEEELRRLAAKFGTIARFLMPPNRSLSVCEFAHEQEARKG